MWNRLLILGAAVIFWLSDVGCCEKEDTHAVPVGFVLVNNVEALDLLKRSAYRKNRDIYDAEVFNLGGRLIVKEAADRLDVLPNLIISMEERNPHFIKPTNATKALDGWVLEYNYGEFGSELWWFSMDLKQRELLGEKVNAIKVTKDGVYIATGDVNSGKGGVLFARNVDGKIDVVNKHSLNWAVFDFSRSLTEGSLFLTEIGLILENDKYGMGELRRNPQELLTGCRTLAAFKDGTIYLGGPLKSRPPCPRYSLRRSGKKSANTRAALCLNSPAM